MKKIAKIIGITILSTISVSWASFEKFSPWIICGEGMQADGKSGDGRYYSARCPNGVMPDGFGCAYHLGRFVWVAYIKDVDYIVDSTGEYGHYSVSQNQMNNINQVCKDVDKKAEKEYAQYRKEGYRLTYAINRQGDFGGGHFANFHPFKVDKSGKKNFSSFHYLHQE
ncbi:hypothetical protein PsalN5692_03970 (plasmid) [Piscirickettsia salmonis]|uniref:hypothetical protein n=1 Tax=Piscirickettsia salmonis TaxID=1238 RepID=UPI0012B8F78C|nr:hypothetical protein [Piscirickettsia salmonis]QGP52461.1 hypothetical protein PsalN5692_03970 [Piscirickettsia salmonis]